ncbi:hypothetical protein LCGC14_0643550 [marine sediment metagenome]|uniref:Uncharacterized protein n=1 Tax=marine sediment metagenome TaxID=412755 RepID=A0A0F9R3N1_9ZZZZ
MPECEICVTRDDCDRRHQNTNRWSYAILILFGIAVSCAGGASVVAWGASQGVAVHKASQEEVNKRVLDSLKRIEVDVRSIRNGHK